MTFLIKLRSIFPVLLVFALSPQTFANHTGDDGYRLWLKYDLIADESQRKHYQKHLKYWRVEGNSDTHSIIRQELSSALNGLLGKSRETHSSKKKKSLLVGTPNTSAQLASYADELQALGDEGYLIKSDRKAKRIIVAANTDIGALYGSFHFIRLLQTGEAIDNLDIKSTPKIQVRTLNHWDNLDRHVERGYAGESIWDWHKLPEYKHQRYYDYARANASIGINATVLNNVNADALAITPLYLEKVKALADIFRPYGIKVYLSVKFSSPQLIGGLETSDPIEPSVQQWWKDKADEIYKTIPDFGGFLVKANSEGQPGPGDFGRTHAQGANMLADALSPHGGIVMWRAFVYANEKQEERSKQAYSEFKPLDGKFRNNVLVQVKNGPIDFQPREPFSPLFGATPQTPIMMEFQITMEYLGFSTHLVYLGTMYKEALNADTFAKGQGSSVAKVVDGSLFDNPISGMAGVANIGTDRNWTGHPILQANWYVFGRLAWDHQLTAEHIADEWIRMSISRDASVVETVKSMMMASREHTVNYMTPLGLHHLMATGHHYGPGPWVDDLGRADWNPVYYHRANKHGIGLDRSPSGENAVEQYFSPVREQLSKPSTTPENLLLWFHHVAWDYKMQSGQTLWEELVGHYYSGAEAVKAMRAEWQKLEAKLDPLQFKEVDMALEIQVNEAEWWRNACVLYFQSISGLEIPEGLEAPQGSLDDYIQRDYPHAPGNG